MDQADDAVEEDTGIDLAIVDSAVRTINTCHRLPAGRSRRRLLQEAVNDLCTTLEDSIVTARKAAQEKQASSNSTRRSLRVSRKRQRTQDSDSSGDEEEYGHTNGRRRPRRAARLSKEPSTPLSLASSDESADDEDDDENIVESDESPLLGRTRVRTRSQALGPPSRNQRASNAEHVKPTTPGTRRSTRLASVAAQVAVAEAINMDKEVEAEESSSEEEDDSEANDSMDEEAAMEQMSESDESETEGIELPIVRPRPKVEINCLASDKHSKTPVYTTDDEDTDGEENKVRRRARHQRIIDEKEDERISKLPPIPPPLPPPPPPPDRAPNALPNAQVPNGMRVQTGMHQAPVQTAVAPAHGGALPYSQPLRRVHPAAPYAVTQGVVRAITAPTAHVASVVRGQGVVPQSAAPYTHGARMPHAHPPAVSTVATSYGYATQRATPLPTGSQARQLVAPHELIHLQAQQHERARLDYERRRAESIAAAQAQAQAAREAQVYRQMQAARQAEEQRKRAAAEEARRLALAEEQRKRAAAEEARRLALAEQQRAQAQAQARALLPTAQPVRPSRDAQNAAKLKELQQQAQKYSTHAYTAKQRLASLSSEARKQRMGANIARDKVELERKKLAHLDQEYQKHRKAMVNSVQAATLELAACEERAKNAQNEIEALEQQQTNSMKNMYTVEHQIHLLRQQISIQAVQAHAQAQAQAATVVGAAPISANEMVTVGSRNRTQHALRRIEEDFQEKNTADISDLEKLLNKDERKLPQPNGHRTAANGADTGGTANNPAVMVANLHSVDTIGDR